MSLESAHEIAIARDASDPLRPWRAHFELPPGPDGEPPESGLGVVGVVHPGPRRGVMAEHAEPCPVVEFLHHRWARGLGHDAQGVTDEVEGRTGALAAGVGSGGEVELIAEGAEWVGAVLLEGEGFVGAGGH